MFYDTKKKAKAEKAIQELKRTKLKARYTVKINLHSHYTKWETPKFISQYSQGLKKEFQLYHLMSTLLPLKTFPYLWTTHSTAQMTHQWCMSPCLTQMTGISLSHKLFWVEHFAKTCDMSVSTFHIHVPTCSPEASINCVFLFFHPNHIEECTLNPPSPGPWWLHDILHNLQSTHERNQTKARLNTKHQLNKPFSLTPPNQQKPPERQC